MSGAAAGGVVVRRDLQRGLNPLVWLLPRYLFASALVTQCAALLIPLAALADIARGMHAMATAVGVVALAVLVVDHLSSPVGSVTCRLRALASGHIAVLVLGYTLAWYLRAGGAPLTIFVIEILTFCIAVIGTRGALAAQGDREAEPESWPFRPAQ